MSGTTGREALCLPVSDLGTDYGVRTDEHRLNARRESKCPPPQKKSPNFPVMGLAVYTAETTHDPAYFPSASCTTLFPPRPQSPYPCGEAEGEQKPFFFQLKSIVIETARATTGHLLCLLYQKHPLGQSQQTLRACVCGCAPTHTLHRLPRGADGRRGNVLVFFGLSAPFGC